MIVQPKIRGFICTTAHPQGCALHVQEQIDFVLKQPPVKNGPKKVLVIGASTGYGLSSRIVAAFGSQAATLGVFFERPAEPKRTATAGWYNSIAFHQKAKEAGLYAKSINGDAFSDEVRAKAIEIIKKDLGQVDCVIYSVASPRRMHPKTKELFKSVLKPKEKSYTNKSIDFAANEIIEITLPPADIKEVEQTVAVMGGEDWELWINALENHGVLAPGAITLAYSYIGPDVTQPVYRNGTIGAAKDHLEATAHKLDAQLKKRSGRALVSVNKALVTQSSSAIPFIPLYFVILMKVMKKKNVHEDCIHQMVRLFSQRIYTGQSLSEIPVDPQGRVRVDDWEMREDIQSEVQAIWKTVANENVQSVGDVAGYNSDFLKLFGLGFPSIDYNKDIEVDLKSEDIIEVVEASV